jgi:nucleoside 2-deoxyribosyltransferase
MKKVYLAGPITEDPRTHQWRREAAKKLGEKFEIDDPCASKFDRETLKEAEGDAEKIHKLVDQHQSEILLPKSYQSVVKSDIILVNFSIEPTDRPIIGTVMEIAWAYVQHKTVIAIKGPGYYVHHPMITGAVHAWADTLDEAIEILKEFYSTRR